MRKGLVRRPEDWLWSSYYNFALHKATVAASPIQIDYVRLALGIRLEKRLGQDCTDRGSRSHQEESLQRKTADLKKQVCATHYSSVFEQFYKRHEGRPATPVLHAKHAMAPRGLLSVSE